MNVNRENMLFENLTDHDAKRLRSAVEELVQTGHIMPDARYFFEVWRVSLGYDERQGMMLMNTAFPQRALLSLLRRNDERH
jgi:hypothetical protein